MSARGLYLPHMTRSVQGRGYRGWVVFGLLRGWVVLLASLLGVQFAQAQNYSVTNLGSINSSVPEKGINGSGQVAFYDYIGGSYRTFFFNGASSQNIGSLGGSSTFPSAVNALGHVVGY